MVSFITVIASPVEARPQPTAEYIVILREGTSPSTLAKSINVPPSHLYKYAVTGFSAALTDAQASKLASSDLVQSITRDRVFSLGLKPPDVVEPQPDQFASFAVARVDTQASPTAHIDGHPDPIPVDVAVLDTGIDPSHPDLDVRGGADCTEGNGWADTEGHGTMVAGFIGARDNAIGVFGVAPDARLWSVRVADKKGNIRDSDLLCGLDWVSQHSDVIRVANLSLSGDHTDTPNCGEAAAKKNRDPIHQAICRVVSGGVTVVVAAGNDARDASLSYPASYDEVITVSAITDLDGMPGGLQPVRGPGSCSYELNNVHPIADDTFAFYSNFGADVDIAAPGTCASSTYPFGQYAAGVGTSFAAPVVSGAAALFLATHPSATPADVKAALLAAAEPGPIVGDPDTFPEGIVNVSTF
jgi:subtilisin